jgi:hypothetical protein
MPRDPDSPSWWHTLPGVLTAIAALITAVGGLVAVLIQTGVIHTSRTTSGSGPIVVSSPPTTPTGENPPPAPGDAPPGARKSWAETEAVLTDANGATVVHAPSLSNCISVSHELTVNGSQDIPFERMRSFEVLRADPAGTPAATATVRIRLLDGRAIEGRIDAQCDIFGYNDLGRYTTSWQSLRKADFRW